MERFFSIAFALAFLSSVATLIQTMITLSNTIRRRTERSLNYGYKKVFIRGSFSVILLALSGFFLWQSVIPVPVKIGEQVYVNFIIQPEKTEYPNSTVYYISNNEVEYSASIGQKGSEPNFPVFRDHMLGGLEQKWGELEIVKERPNHVLIKVNVEDGSQVRLLYVGLHYINEYAIITSTSSVSTGLKQNLLFRRFHSTVRMK